ncbi:MAG: imidazole glycerol phosphate synthase subunit HisH [Proteobacteria bacterium]|nr:imidazole glycerol phosphate synthase subunit HisH [Pseudomonadota bacterium]
MTLILDYDAGNLGSVKRACSEVGLQAEFAAHPDALEQAERIIFPGVGAAGSAMRSLRERGLDTALKNAIAKGTPLLGICLGMQVSLDHSEENDTPTLGLLGGRVQRFKLNRPELKIPHMGWNEVKVQQSHPVLAGIEPGDEFYFVHGYYPMPTAPEHVLTLTEYEGDFVSAVGKNNYIGTQFHPEKSGQVGLRLFENFARWDGVWQSSALPEGGSNAQ